MPPLSLYGLHVRESLLTDGWPFTGDILMGGFTRLKVSRRAKPDVVFCETGRQYFYVHVLVRDHIQVGRTAQTTVAAINKRPC